MIIMLEHNAVDNSNSASLRSNEKQDDITTESSSELHQQYLQNSKKTQTKTVICCVWGALAVWGGQHELLVAKKGKIANVATVQQT